MKILAKIIYTIIVCKFLMGIRERLMSKVHVDPTKLNQLMRDMVDRGFETVSGEKMAIVKPIGNNMFKSVYSKLKTHPSLVGGMTAPIDKEKETI